MIWLKNSIRFYIRAFISYDKFFEYSSVILFFVSGLIVLNYHSDIPVEELKNKYAKEHSKFIRVDGLDVHCQRLGKGAPLVLIQGMQDELIPADQILSWYDDIEHHGYFHGYEEPKISLTYDNATHFFHGHLTQIRKDWQQAIKTTIVELAE